MGIVTLNRPTLAGNIDVLLRRCHPDSRKSTRRSPCCRTSVGEFPDQDHLDLVPFSRQSRHRGELRGTFADGILTSNRRSSSASFAP